MLFLLLSENIIFGHGRTSLEDTYFGSPNEITFNITLYSTNILHSMSYGMDHWQFLQISSILYLMEQTTVDFIVDFSLFSSTAIVTNCKHHVFCYRIFVMHPIQMMKGLAGFGLSASVSTT